VKCPDCNAELTLEAMLLAAIFGEKVPRCAICTNREQMDKCTICQEPTSLSLNGTFLYPTHMDEYRLASS